MFRSERPHNRSEVSSNLPVVRGEKDLEKIASRHLHMQMQKPTGRSHEGGRQIKHHTASGVVRSPWDGFGGYRGASVGRPASEPPGEAAATSDNDANDSDEEET